MAFHVGQMVVCVDDSPAAYVVKGKKTDPLRLLEKGRIYTVRRVSDYQFYDMKAPAIWLDEVVRPTRVSKDTPFGASRFRPVRTTDISIFTSLLAHTERETV